MTTAGPGGEPGWSVDGRWGHVRYAHRPQSSSGLLYTGREFLHEVVHIPILTDEPRDLGVRVHDGGVVAPAELLSDLRQRRVGELTGEVHGDLARVDDVLRAPVAGQLLEGD